VLVKAFMRASIYLDVGATLVYCHNFDILLLKKCCVFYVTIPD
jgi:hypothetical protein